MKSLNYWLVYVLIIALLTALAYGVSVWVTGGIGKTENISNQKELATPIDAPPSPQVTDTVNPYKKLYR
jgi:HAMP domain-containing protein